MRRGRYLPVSINSQAGGFSASSSLSERSHLGFWDVGMTLIASTSNPLFLERNRCSNSASEVQEEGRPPEAGVCGLPARSARPRPPSLWMSACPFRRCLGP